MDFSNLLNEEQIKPVLDTEGQVLVLAGAGSGKTRVLTYRIAHLIADLNVNPYNILAITFTNKAAKEMQERIEKLVGLNSRIWVSTFHSFCAKILRADINKIGYTSNFTIYTETETDRVLKSILEEKNISDKNFRGKVKYHISNAKNMGYNPVTYGEAFSFEDSDTVCEIFAAYERRLKESNALDFDDLLVKALELFLKNPEVLGKYQEKFKYIHIDEFQDTNKIQYMLARVLADKYKNIFVVGDDDQSIYGWRGAEIENILNFKKNFPDAKIYKLERNYRSTSNILNAANSVIKNNSSRLGKTLWTEETGGVRVEHRRLFNDREEAEYVVQTIYRLAGEHGYSYDDFAILVRQNALTRLFEEKLTLYSIPYKIYGGFKFYERKEIRDLLAYLRLISNPKDNEALMRIINFPKRGIGESSIIKLMHYAEENEMSMFDALGCSLTIGGINSGTKIKMKELFDILNLERERVKNCPLNEFIRGLIVNLGIEKEYKTGKEEDLQRLENTLQLVGAAREFIFDNEGGTLDDFLQSISLISDLDKEYFNSSVTLATIHSVKGLEFKVVFIVGLEEGIFPSGKIYYEPKELEEERRVMYVAITRAMERLYFTNAQSRFRFNKVENNLQSRFINEALGIREENLNGYSFKSRDAVDGSVSFDGIGIDKKVNKYIPTEVKPKSMNANKLLKKDLSLFKPGVKVKHIRFGEGVILTTRGENADIKFEKLGIKSFNLTVAPLEIIE